MQLFILKLGQKAAVLDLAMFSLRASSANGVVTVSGVADADER